MQNSGAPNITGEFAGGDSRITPSGAFTQIPNENGFSGSSGRFCKVKFDAKSGETKTDGTLKTSSEHKVYGSSDDLQVKNTTIRLWRRTA